MGKLAAVLGVVAVLSGVALATGELNAWYERPDPLVARVHITGDPGCYYRIFGEQPDGLYLLVAEGPIAGGHEIRHVPHSGPINESPQFRIEIEGPSGPLLINLSDKEYAFD